MTALESMYLPSYEDETVPVAPKEEKGARWKRLEGQYGRVRAMWPFLFGEKEHDRLSEREPKLPWYSANLIYVTSFAAGLVSGSVDMIAIGQGFKEGDPVKIFVSSLMFGALLLMVIGMDKSLARTIPRIGILSQRGERGALTECILYSSAVGLIEIATLTVLVMNENKISDILKGVPIIPTNSGWFAVIAISRATMTFWTIVHSFLVNEPLPVQLSTAKREAAELFGGQLIRRIRALESRKGIRLGKLLENFILSIAVIPKAAKKGEEKRTKNKKGEESVIQYDRAQRQVELDREHHDALIAALDELEQLPMRPKNVQIRDVSKSETSDTNAVRLPLSNAGAANVESVSSEKPVSQSGADFSISAATNNDSDLSDDRALSRSQNGTAAQSDHDDADRGGNRGGDGALSSSEMGVFGQGEYHESNIRDLLPLAHALSSSWNIPGHTNPEELLNPSEISRIFGLTDRTLVRNYDKNGPDHNIPRPGGSFRLGDVLWMYEQGWFNSASHNFEDFRQAEPEVVTNGHVA